MSLDVAGRLSPKAYFCQSWEFFVSTHKYNSVRYGVVAIYPWPAASILFSTASRFFLLYFSAPPAPLKVCQPWAEYVANSIHHEPSWGMAPFLTLRLSDSL